VGQAEVLAEVQEDRAAKVQEDHLARVLKDLMAVQVLVEVHWEVQEAKSPKDH